MVPLAGGLRAGRSDGVVRRSAGRVPRPYFGARPHAESEAPPRVLFDMPTPDHLVLWSTLSQLGAPVTMLTLCVANATSLIVRRERRAALAVILLQISGGLLDMTIKNIVKRPRPPGSDQLLHGFSYSFPSGHTMGATIGYGMLCYCVLQYTRLATPWRVVLTMVSVFVVLVIGTSRIQLGVHYRGDVVGGVAIGAAWLGLGVLLLRHVEAEQTAVPVMN